MILSNPAFFPFRRQGLWLEGATLQTPSEDLWAEHDH